MTYDREQLILSLLRHLDAAAEIGQALPESYLLQVAKNEGRPLLKAEELLAELEALAKGNLVQPVIKVPGAPAHWRITGTGRNRYAQITT